MCAISGMINLPASEKTVRRMLETMHRRGPDDRGVYREKGCTLLHGRLAIIDPEGGRQPMTLAWAGEEYTLVYNGELYNTEQLRGELSALGHSFLGHSDTEVLLHAYAQFGAACVEKLNGIFAFAVWEKRRGRLFLARDRIGVKPLFYCKKGRLFAFASRIPTLLLLPEVEPVVDRSGLAEIFMLGPARSPGHAVFRDLAELPPACYLTYDHGTLQVHRYWKLHAAPHTDSPADTIERTHQLVTDAVERQLVSDVPVCTFLSGGLDSSIISEIAARQMAAQGERLCTYSVDYEDNDRYFQKSLFQPNADSDYIGLMAEAIGSDHRNVVLNNVDVAEALVEATLARGVPGFTDVDSSLLLFCRQVHRDFKVCLSGECADEIFGGYPWYHRQKILFADTFPWSRSVDVRQSLLRPGLLPEGADYVQAAYRRTVADTEVLDTDSPLEKRMRQMFRLNTDWFMQTLLMRKDAMSMHSSLEVRVPFCDWRLVEYAYNMPWALKSPEGREKGVLRKAFEGELPYQIAWRKKSPYPKTYHPAYEQMLIRRMREILNDPNSPVLPLLDRSKTEAFLAAPKELGKPWFGQLMAGPQLIAYFIQINTWMQIYHLSI